MKKILILIAFAGILYSCNKDDFAALNQDPSTVNTPDMRYLFTNGLYHLDNDGMYTEWFYDYSQYILPWTQTTVSSTGNTQDVVNDREHGDRLSNLYTQVAPPLTEIQYFVDKRYTGKDQVAYRYIKYATYPIEIMQALKVSDMYGSIAYTQAMKAKYTNPALLTPVLDNQETLFNTWVAELDSTIKVLTTDQKYNGETISQIALGSQDFVYNGDWKKWAKLANSLKLRIAVRLLNSNKTLALNIANEAIASPAGLITENADNLYFSPASDYYHFGNSIGFGVGSKNLIDFLRNNQDPRLRFIFSKNSFNSKVVQAFFDAGKDVPPYILANVNYQDVTTTDATTKITTTKHVFVSWKGQGEPWVRYYGAPTTPDAKTDATLNNEYFNTDKFTISGKSYSPTSYYNGKNVQSNLTYTYPDVPGTTNTVTDLAPYHSLLVSAAEINLYLAELKLQGATVSSSANALFQKAISQSVSALNQLAGDNHLLYYSSVYDSNEKKIALADGEITALLAQPAYQLTGDVPGDLEKIYIQEYINSLNIPNELFVTIRRTGFPKEGSSILAKESFQAGGINLVVPRRFTIPLPTTDDINYSNKVKAYSEEGFTAGSNDVQILHDQRLWYDKNAPDWGKGN